MIRVLGGGTRTCDGITRREILRVGGLSLLGGLTLPQRVAAQPIRGRARSVILINLLGGPAHLDMFDMKPDAPSDIRGEFRPIDTSIPGLQICEHLSRTARLMRHSTLIRTVTHNYNSHDPFTVLTGATTGDPASQARPDDPPSIGAVCSYLGLGAKDVPAHACLPCYPGWGQNWRRRGPYGGFLGSRHDPLFSVCSPTFDRKPSRPYYDAVNVLGAPRLEGLDPLPQITLDRLHRRKSLLQQFDERIASATRAPAIEQASRVQQQAFDLLTSGKVRHSFDLGREAAETRDRYGRNLYGQSMLLARRLIEVGVVFVTVTYEVFETNAAGNGIAFDTHENNFDALRRVLLPSLDQGYSALVEDLIHRGMLGETLVIVMGEMGRTPKVNSKAGRDHWPQCSFALLTGGGVKSGMVHGRSDAIGAYPTEDPVAPGDLAATVYQLLGIDPERTVPDSLSRPVAISHGGVPIRAIMA